jgi:hypothetical protein
MGLKRWSTRWNSLLQQWYIFCKIVDRLMLKLFQTSGSIPTTQSSSVCDYDSEIQAITAPAPSIIFTIRKSLQHTLSILEHAVSSPAVPWKRLLTVQIFQLHSLRSCIHRFHYRTQLNWLSQSQSYFTTDGLPPISSSWRQAPWDLRPVILFSNWTLAVIVLM